MPIKICLIILLVPLLLFATDYYVKTGGSNGNTGLSDAQAWETITYAMTQVSANDVVYLNGGDTFAETATLSQNGLIIKSYGSGKAIIDGADTRNYGIIGTAKNDVTIENLIVKSALLANIISDGCNDWIIRNCEVDSAGNGNDYGIFLASDNYAFADGGHLVDNCTIDGILGEGIFCQRVRNITITNTTITKCDTGAGGNSGDNVQFLDCTGGTLRNNVFSQQGSNSIKGNLVCESPAGVTPANWTVENNELAYGNFGMGFYRPGPAVVDSVTIRYNYIHDQAGGGQIQSIDSPSSNWVVAYNILADGNTGINFGDVGGTWADTLHKIYNNTVWNQAVYCLAGENFDGEVKNNIFWNPPGRANTYWMTISGTLDSDNNIIGPEATNFVYQAGSNYATLAAYQSGESQDASSLKDDPVFADTAASNYGPRLSSAVNGGTDVGLTEDFYGRRVPHGSAPDIGAIEQADKSARIYLMFRKAK